MPKEDTAFKKVYPRNVGSHLSAILAVAVAVSLSACQEAEGARREQVPSIVSPQPGPQNSLPEASPSGHNAIDIPEDFGPPRAEDELEPGKVGTYRTKEGIHLTVPEALRIDEEDDAKPKYRLLWNFDRGEHIYRLRKGIVDAVTGEVVYIKPMRIH